MAAAIGRRYVVSTTESREETLLRLLTEVRTRRGEVDSKASRLLEEAKSLRGMLKEEKDQYTLLIHDLFSLEQRAVNSGFAKAGPPGLAKPPAGASLPVPNLPPSSKSPNLTARGSGNAYGVAPPPASPAGPVKEIDLAKIPFLKNRFHANASRDDCAKILKGKKPMTYIVRKSSKPTSFALSYVSQDGKGIDHLLVCYSATEFWMDHGDGARFQSLEALIQDYQFI